MKEHLSIDQKLDVLSDVARDFMGRDGLRQQRVLDLIDELGDDIKREIADARDTASEPKAALTLSTETVDNPVHTSVMTDAQRETLKHLVARGSTLPDHNGRSGSVSRVDYAHLQAAAEVLSALLRESEPTK
jgi:hypothetical protein